MRYHITSGQPESVSPSGFGYPTIIENKGPYPVYLGFNTGIANDPVNEGLRLPPQAYKEWNANIPLYVMTASGQESDINVVPNQGGLLTPPIGQVSVSLAATNSVSDGDDYGPYDMTRFDSFHVYFKDSSTVAAGTTMRQILVYWLLQPATLITQENIVDMETHYVYCQGGWMRLRGKVKAPYLYIAMNATGFTPNAMVIDGYLTPIGENRVNNYGADIIIGGTLGPTAGTVIIGADGFSQGVMRYNVAAASLGAGISDIFVFDSWAGPAQIDVLALSAITTNPMQFTLLANNVAFWFGVLNVTTANRSYINEPVYLPTGNIRMQINNNSGAGVQIAAGLSMARHD